MKKIFLLFFLSITVHHLFAQQDSLLKTFKFRINNYRALSFNIGGENNFYREAFSFSKYNTASGNAGVIVFFNKSSDRILLNGFANVNGNFYKNKTIRQSYSDKFTSFATIPAISIVNKWFSNNKFTELGVDATGNFYSSKRTDLSSKIKNKFTNYLVTLHIGIGKGRLENVTYMQNALWLQKALVASKQINRVLSAEELNGLGQAITTGNNTRVLDTRKRTQFLLKTVDKFLQQNGLIDKTDIDYFNSLNDILFFAYNNTRFAGKEKFIRLSPGIGGWGNFSRDDSPSSGSDNIQHLQSIVLSSGIKKYIPTSLTHQNNYGAAVKLAFISMNFNRKYFIDNILNGEIKNKAEVKKAGLDLFYEHAIYPNTRTDITFGLQTESGYQRENGRNEIYTTSTLSGNLRYFISYRTRLSLSISANYQKNNFIFNNYILYTPNDIVLLSRAGVEINL